MKVNISLVGGQPFPVFAQALDAKPDILVLIHSKRTEEQAMLIKQCVKNKLHATSVSLTEADAYDLKQSEITLKATINAWAKPDNQVTVNIAGGTKPWALQLYRLALDRENVKCVFIDQNNKVWDMKSFKSHSCDHGEINIDDLFELNGVTGHYKEFDHADDEAANIIEKLYLADQNALYTIVYEHLLKDEVIKGNIVKKGKLSINVKDENEIECCIGYDNNLYLVSSPNAKRLLVNYGWFEHKVARVLSQWYDAKRVLVNAEFKLENSTRTANEIDIIVETKSGKYLFVECKTSVKDSTNIDKFNTAVKTYGGLGSKRIFVTYYNMKGLPKSKCDKLGIDSYAYNSISRDKASQSRFFDALDREMATINAR